MYAVIYWIEDEGPYSYTKSGKIKTFSEIGNADDSADMIEERWSEDNRKIMARVISIEPAKE